MKVLYLFIIWLFIYDAQAQVVQWRGPNRDGKFPDTGLLNSWPESGPGLILKIDSLGAGYSSAQYYKNTIYITGKIDDKDYISAYTMNGDRLWRTKYDDAWFRSYSDSRCTPTIKEDRIYLIGGSGRLVCIDATNGNVHWERDIQTEYEGEWARFGTGEAPLLVDDLVVATVGGNKTTMVALHTADGTPAWQTNSIGGERSYGSPKLYERNGVRQILGFTSKNVFGVNPENGKVMWNHPYFPENKRVKSRGAFMTNTPLVHENEIYYTCGYDVPAIKLAIAEDGQSVKTMWVDTMLDVHHHGVVYVDGYIYGTNWYNNRQGDIICLDWETGKVNYKHDFGGKSSVIYADGMLYFYQERSGEVALAKPNPEKFEMVSSFKVEHGTGPHWAHPTIYDKKLFIRHGETLMVYDIKDN
jgi:outer membrane protein assembly factor BamB